MSPPIAARSAAEVRSMACASKPDALAGLCGAACAGAVEVDSVGMVLQVFIPPACVIGGREARAFLR